MQFRHPQVFYLLSRAGMLTATTLREQWRMAIVVLTMGVTLVGGLTTSAVGVV